MSTTLDPLAHARQLTREGAGLDAQARAWQRATEADPSQVETWRSFVDVLLRGQRPQLAFAVLQRAVQLFSQDGGLWGRGGTVLQAAGQLEHATTWLGEAARVEPGSANHHANLAHHLHRCRDDDGALAHAERALELAPGHPLAVHTRACIARRRGDALAAEAGFTEVLDAPQPELRAASGLALARLLHEDGRHDLAWHHAERAQALRRQLGASQDVTWLPRTVSRAREAWSHGVPAPVLPADPLAPVFVVGFIRSGTTLVEQVLAACLPTSDEAPILDATRQWLAANSPAFAQRGQAALAELPASLLAGARAEYHRQARAQLGVQGRFVHKLPLDLLQLPLIRALFPAAPIVVVLRDARDCVASTFFQDLTLNPANVHFTELHALARSYTAVMGLWRDWRGRVPGVLELHYEALVADPERESRALLAHARLPWRAEVLRFFEQAGRRAIVTPSADAVSEPIHTRATGRWQAYRRQLAPVLPLLAPFVSEE